MDFMTFFNKSTFQEEKILLFSSNPIPAGPLLIPLSTGPLVLLSRAKSRWEYWPLIIGLTLGALVIILLGKRGPILAILVMTFF